jgi:hypothetical protein
MYIREAAVRYGVSRAKLHRLVQLGRLATKRDPRDERVTLLRTEQLETLFRFPSKEAEDMRYRTGAETENVAEAYGRLTPELRTRIDVLRERISGGRRLPGDSADIIREEREKRSQQVFEAAFGFEAYEEEADSEV